MKAPQNLNSRKSESQVIGLVFVCFCFFNKTEYPKFCFVFETVNEASQFGLMNLLYSYLPGPTSWVLGL